MAVLYLLNAAFMYLCSTIQKCSCVLNTLKKWSWVVGPFLLDLKKKI